MLRRLALACVASSFACAVLGCSTEGIVVAPGADGVDADEGDAAPDGGAETTVVDPAAYWRDEMAAQGARPSTGAGLLTDAGCATPGWAETPSSCEQPCASQNPSDGGDAGGNVLYIPDTELCITNLCPPPFAKVDVTMRVGSGFAGVLAVPFHCDGGVVTCACLPPDVCGTGRCVSVAANAIICDCPPDP